MRVATMLIGSIGSGDEKPGENEGEGGDDDQEDIPEMISSVAPTDQ